MQLPLELLALQSQVEVTKPAAVLSDREVEVIALLAQRLRDRDIAEKLYISESTVKFQINNSLTKLPTQNRYQGGYQAVVKSCI